MSSIDRLGVICVSAPAEFIFAEGQLADGVAPYPGQCVSPDPAAGVDGDGRPKFKMWDGAADGERSTVYVVRENELMGKLPTTRYTAGSRVFLAIPRHGAMMHVLLKDVDGTAEGVLINDKLIIDDGTGYLIPTTGTPEMEPFEAIEAIAAIPSDQLVLCRYTGH